MATSSRWRNRSWRRSACRSRSSSTNTDLLHDGARDSPANLSRVAGRAPLTPTAEVEALLPSVVDAAERIIPGLGNQSVGAAVGAHLVTLHDQLVRRDALGIRLTVGAIRSQLLSYGTAARLEDGAELSAIELVLDGVDRLLSEPIP